MPLRMIDSLGLHEPIFWLPPDIKSSLSAIPRSPSLGLASATILHAIFAQFDDPNTSSPFPTICKDIIEFTADDKDIRRRLYLGSALTPYREVTFREKKRDVSALEGIARYGLKVLLLSQHRTRLIKFKIFLQLGNTNYYMDAIPALFAAATALSIPSLKKFTHSSGSERVAIGLVLRDKNIHNELTGTHWTTSLLFSLVQDLVETIHPDDGKYLAENVDCKSDFYLISKLYAHRSWLYSLAEKAGAVVDTYNTFFSKVVELDLPSSFRKKSILDVRGSHIQDNSRF